MATVVNFVLGIFVFIYIMAAGLLGCIDNKPFDEDAYVKERKQMTPHYEYKDNHWEVEWKRKKK